MTQNINKVVLNDNVLIDLTGDNVEPQNMREGYTALDKYANLITGTMPEALWSGLYNVSYFATGTITLASNVSTSTSPIQSKFSAIKFVPHVLFFFSENGEATSTYTDVFMMRGEMEWGANETYKTVCLRRGSSTTMTGTIANYNNYGIMTVPDGSFSAKINVSSNGYYWRKGTYRYVAFRHREL